MRSCLVVLVVLWAASFAGAQDGSETTLWLTAKVVEEGDRRTVYFGGRVDLPAGTKVDVFLRRKGDIFEAARAVVGRKDQTFEAARVGLGGMPAADLDFANKIGPLAQMVTGEWDLYAIAKADGASHEAVFPLIVGDPAVAADDEAAEVKRLLEAVLVLETHLGEARALKAEFDKIEDWTADVETRWIDKARAIQTALQAMSNRALGERARVLAPMFPFVNMVLTQMPLKCVDLINGFHAYHRYRTVEKGAPGGFDLGVLVAIEREITTHIELSRRQLATHDATHLAAFYEDFAKLESLLAELRRCHRRAKAQAPFNVAQWHALAANAGGVHAIVVKRLARYRAGEVGKAAPKVVDELDGALDLANRLVGLLTQDLYVHHGTPKEERIPIEAELPAGVASREDLELALAKHLTQVRAFATRAREEMRDRLLVLLGEINADAFTVLERGEAPAGDLAELEKLLSDLRRRCEERKLDEGADGTTYWPGLHALLESLSIDVAAIATEVLELAKGNLLEKVEARGAVLEIDRRILLGNHTNNVLRINAQVQLRLEHRDDKLLGRITAWMQKRGIEVDPVAQAELDALAKAALPEHRR